MGAAACHRPRMHVPDPANAGAGSRALTTESSKLRSNRHRSGRDRDADRPVEPSLSRLFRILRCSRNLLSSCCATKLAAPPWTSIQAPFTRLRRNPQTLAGQAAGQ